MNEFKSKCCKEKVWVYEYPISIFGEISNIWCSKCHKPTEIKEKEKEVNTP